MRRWRATTTAVDRQPKCFGLYLEKMGIHQLNVNRTVGNGLVVVGGLVVGKANVYEFNRLSRPIKRAISKVDR